LEEQAVTTARSFFIFSTAIPLKIFALAPGKDSSKFPIFSQLDAPLSSKTSMDSNVAIPPMWECAHGDRSSAEVKTNSHQFRTNIFRFFSGGIAKLPRAASNLQMLWAWSEFSTKKLLNQPCQLDCVDIGCAKAW
jgi:hypothetical protein